MADDRQIGRVARRHPAVERHQRRRARIGEVNRPAIVGHGPQRARGDGRGQHRFTLLGHLVERDPLGRLGGLLLAGGEEKGEQGKESRGQVMHRR